MNKSIASIHDALSRIEDGSTLMIGGFGGAGSPVELIHALIDHGPKGLTVINNNAGNGDVGLAAMIREGMVSRLICSFPRSADASAFTSRFVKGEIELELVPQGTLAERIRAGGAGIPAFFTPAGFGTELGQGKPTEEIEGKHYVRESWLKADYALIKADTGDVFGNLVYRMAARNFGPLMAMAAQHTIAQVSRIVQAGEIGPEIIVTPGIFVDAIVEFRHPEQEEIMYRKGARYP